MRCALLLLLLSTASGAAAQEECSCLWQGSFAEVQAGADLVVAVQSLASKGNSVDFSVEKTLRGRTAMDEIRVWMQARDYCRPPAADFPAGSRWVLALDRIEQSVPGGFDPLTPNISYGRIGDYQLSSCGGYWLKLEQEHVTGPLVDSPRWVREPQMTPVLLELVDGYVNGRIDQQTLLEASREDPALRELRLNTRAFLRQGGETSD